MRGPVVAAIVVAVVASLAGACGDDAGAGGCDNEDVTGDASVVVWTDSDGCEISTLVVHSSPGDAECGWELVDVIVIGDAVYHWDPVNLLAYVDQQVRNRTFRTADVIGELTDTGWRRGTEELWRPTDDDTHVFVVRGDQTDRYLLDAEGAIVCAS
ncbi:MAG: hypothetical protein DHS20C19_03430 [Acidimicrobiales bacterium]|nr:MAG: hypothetical protein DHS20C19_03430 [Acidimicrobiales bacterium]